MNKLIKENSHILIGLIIGLSTALIIICANHLKLWDQFELKTLDMRFKTFYSFRQEPSKDIVVIGIDDLSVAELGRWPWQRSEHAKMVDFLKLYGAKAIFYDTFFSYRDKDHPESDKKFTESVAQAGNVYLPYKFIPDSKDVQDDIQISEKDKLIKKFALNSQNLMARNSQELVPKGKEAAWEISFIETAIAAKRMGTVYTGENEDGICRYNDLVYKYKGNYYPSLSLSTVMDVLKIKDIKNWENRGYILGNSKIPLDEDNRVIVNWRGKYSKGKQQFVPAYDQWSAWRLVKSFEQIQRGSKACGLSMPEFVNLLNKIEYYQNKNLEIPDELMKYIDKIPSDFELKFEGWNPTELFKDKIVLIGVASNSTTVRDVISTPFLEETPGVFLHANVIDNLINNDFLVRVDRYKTSLIILAMGILSALCIFGIRNSIIGVIYPIILALLYFVTALYEFTFNNLWMDIVYVEATIAVTFAISSAVYYIIEGKEKLKVKYALSNYLSPQVMNEVLSDPLKLNLGGTKRELTVLFSDIRGFTTISEQSDPQEIVCMLNEYFSDMVEIIFRNNGTFDKFIGDAIMAFWNAPLEVEDHAYLAVKTAVEMHEQLNKIRSGWTKPINIGIGINTGEVIVGNIGSEKIKDYTIIGDGVNLASRLESLNKEYKTGIIISEYTYELVKDKVETRYLDVTKVKGKDIPVKIYEVLGLKTKGESLCESQEFLHQ